VAVLSIVLPKNEVNDKLAIFILESLFRDFFWLRNGFHFVFLLTLERWFSGEWTEWLRTLSVHLSGCAAVCEGQDCV
jgi:hypothetical protein